MLPVCAILFILPLVGADYTCLCSYSVEIPVHSKPSKSSPAIGYIYEFDCKPLWGDESLYKGTTFVMIQFEKQVRICCCFYCVAVLLYDFILLLFLNFIYFTTITKQVIQLILIMLVGTDVCVRMVFVWEETGEPGETHLSDLMTKWPSHMRT